MRLLRLVGPSADGNALLLEAADSDEQFTLPINERLRNVSSSDLPRLPLPESAAGATPSPREIQTRIRAGATAQQLANEAGIPVERIMRFAFPVLAERKRVVDEARRARARSSHEGQLVDFGNLIDARFARHGLDPATVEWDAFRREDGGWTVTATLTAHEQPLLAKFSFALLNRTVSALDALAADLLSDRPVAALLPPMPTPVTAEVEPTEPATPQLRLASVADRGQAEPAAPAVRPGRRLRARTRPIPIEEDDELFDQDAFDGGAFDGNAFDGNVDDSDVGNGSGHDSGAPAAQRDPVPAQGSAGTDQNWDEPALPLELDDMIPGQLSDADEAAGRDGRRRGRRGDKPRMPSWDDILLGVRHKND